MPLERTIEHHIGTDESYPFRVYDRAGMTDAELEAAIDAGTATIQDITGWSFRFSVRTSDKATGATLIDKESGSPVEIEVVGVYNSDPAVNTQYVLVHLFDTDTASADGSAIVLQPKTYRYSLKRTDDGAETVVTKGDFELSEATER